MFNNPSLKSIRVISIALAGVALFAASSARAQVTSLTSLSSSFSAVKYQGSFLGDTFDNGNAGLDKTKQNGLNGSSSNWDMVGDSTHSLLQIGIGSANDTYFRVRLSDYKNSTFSGSVFVLLNTGTSTIGVGALIDSKNTGVYTLTPTAGTSLNANFSYSVGATPVRDSTYLNYSIAANIDSGVTSISGQDAYLTFRVLNSDLTTLNGGTAVNIATAGYTAFTNTNSVINGQINGDYISFGGTGLSTDPLTFGTVPEPATWASTGAMLACGGLIWWRRRNGKRAA